MTKALIILTLSLFTTKIAYSHDVEQFPSENQSKYEQPAKTITVRGCYCFSPEDDVFNYKLIQTTYFSDGSMKMLEIPVPLNTDDPWANDSCQVRIKKIKACKRIGPPLDEE